MTIRVTLAAPQHAAAVAGLLRDINAEFSAPCPPLEVFEKRFAQLIAGDQAYVVLAQDTAPTGFALITLRPSRYYAGPIATLDELYVRPALRGQGIGSRIMELAESRARTLGVGEVQINVDEVDKAARRFYGRRGYSNIEAGQDYRMLCYVRPL